MQSQWAAMIFLIFHKSRSNGRLLWHSLEMIILSKSREILVHTQRSTRSSMDFIESTSLNTANFPLQSKLSSAEFLTPAFIYASLLPHRDEVAIVYVKTTFFRRAYVMETASVQRSILSMLLFTWLIHVKSTQHFSDIDFRARPIANYAIRERDVIITISDKWFSDFLLKIEWNNVASQISFHL